MNLWENTPGMCEEIPTIEHFAPETKRSDAALLMFAGGAYVGRAEHEGKGYAEYFASVGINSFVVNYRCHPHHFPLPLLDARRAVRFVRANAEKFGIDPKKVVVIGSSAGGHLSALLSTYNKPIDFEGVDEIDEQPFLPDAHVLCYPAIISPDNEGIAHYNTYKFLLGEDRVEELQRVIDPELNVGEHTPPVFIWHTADDDGVNVINSYRYAAAMRKANREVEMHIFPRGDHGLGLSQSNSHVAQWSGLLLNWFRFKGWME